MSDSNADRILDAWVRLETGLRAALPVCSVQPPTQPLELLSALRINGQIGPEQEDSVLELREIRNRVAHHPEEPKDADTEAFEVAVETILEGLGGEDSAGPPWPFAPGCP